MTSAEAFELLGVSESDPPEQIWLRFFPPFSLIFRDEKTIWAHYEAVRIVCDSRSDLKYRLVKIGALPIIWGAPGLAPRVLEEANALLWNDDAASAVVDRLRELGLADLVTRHPAELLRPPNYVEQAVCEALGVDRATWELPPPKPRKDAHIGRSRNEAWFLAVYVHLRRPMEVYHDVLSALQLGRLLEWWRGRRLGLDRLSLEGWATRRERSEGGRKRKRADHKQIINAMKRRIREGQSIRQAARATFSKDGFGSSGSANVEVYKRHLRALKEQG